MSDTGTTTINDTTTETEPTEEDRVREATIAKLMVVYGGDRDRAEQAYQTRKREIAARHILAEAGPAMRAAMGIPQPASSPGGRKGYMHEP